MDKQDYRRLIKNLRFCSKIDGTPCSECEGMKKDGHCHDSEYMSDAADAIETLLNGIEAYRQAARSEWVSVEERLPESGDHCLLCCEIRGIDGYRKRYVCDGYYAERWAIAEGGSFDDCAVEYSEEQDEYFLLEGWYEVIKNWDDYNSVAIGDFVTHWMPLPEPPEVEQKNA